MSAIESALERSRANEAQVAAAAELNRAAMPLVTEMVDETRKLFGDVKVIWAEENGITKGRKR